MTLEKNLQRQPEAQANFTRQYTWSSVREAASGRWGSILRALGVQEQFLDRRHGPCPACGGRDRFRFDDKNGSGSFYCSHCGAGDGFTLIQLVFNFGAWESLQVVASALGIDHGGSDA